MPVSDKGLSKFWWKLVCFFATRFARSVGAKHASIAIVVE